MRQEKILEHIVIRYSKLFKFERVVLAAIAGEAVRYCTGGVFVNKQYNKDSK